MSQQRLLEFNPANRKGHKHHGYRDRGERDTGQVSRAHGHAVYVSIALIRCKTQKILCRVGLLDASSEMTKRDSCELMFMYGFAGIFLILLAVLTHTPAHFLSFQLDLFHT